MPYDGYWGADHDTSEYLDRVLADASIGVDLPAAIILETVQGGGLNTASKHWLDSIERLCRKNGILLIVDDIQAGCGRTGSFFSFEFAGLSPGMIVLSTCLSGCGLPLSLLLLKPEIDAWQPGEHSGTFRGNNLALVTGTAAFRPGPASVFLRHSRRRRIDGVVTVKLRMETVTPTALSLSWMSAVCTLSLTKCPSVSVTIWRLRPLI